MNALIKLFVDKVAPIYPLAKRFLYRFHGGVFPQYYKELSANQPLYDTLIPDKLYIPLQQEIGQKADLLVAVGDYVKQNQLIAHSSRDASQALVVPIHAPTSGYVEALEPHTLPHPSGLKDEVIVLAPDGKHDVITNALEVDGSAPQTPKALKKIILDAGIVGMGGAGFPTYAKIPEQAGKVKTLFINGAECEPFITCDDLLMQTEAHSIIQGALLTANALGTKEVLCGIEANKPTALATMRQAAQNTIIKVIEVPTVYPMGGQKQLIKELTGIEIPFRTHSIDIGLLMMNVATLASIYRAVTFGEPLTSRLVSVSGLGVLEPNNRRVLIGTTFDYLYQAAKPKQTEAYPLIAGGPMLGYEVQDNQVPVLKTTNCILANPPEPTEMQMPCIRCGECMDACPVNLLPQQMYWYSHSNEFEKVEKLNVFDCIECGCCSYVCPSHIPLVQYYRHAKAEIKELRAEQNANELAKQRHEARLERLEREKAEREARLKAKKEAVKRSPGKANTQSEKSTPSHSASAAAKARAAAAKRAAQQNSSKTAPESDSMPEPSSSSKGPSKPMPAARQKAIEAAKKAAMQQQKTAPKAPPQNAADTNKPEKKSSAKQTDNAKKAAKKAAMAAAKKRAQQKAKDNNASHQEDPAEPVSLTKQSSSSTDTPQQSIADKQAAARKAAMQAARQAAKNRQTKAQPKPGSDDSSLGETAKQTAMRLAKERAQAARAKKQANQPESHQEDSPS